nr:hypothetical protein [uncultured Sphingomonas sp.]
MLCALLALFGAAAAWTSKVSPQLFMEICGEDGPVEVVQFGAYFLAGWLLVRQALRQQRNPWLWLFGLFFLLIAGEEVSWGQRVFGIVSPQEIAAVNVQGETNLHNLKWLNGIVRLLGTLVFFGMFVMIPLAQQWSATRWLVSWLRLPVAPFRSSFAFILGLAFMILARALPGLPYGFDEIGELMFAVAALGLAVSVHKTFWRGEEGGGEEGGGAMSLVAAFLGTKAR